MVELMPSQTNEIFAAIEESAFARDDFHLDDKSPLPVFRLAASPSRFWFAISDRSSNAEIWQVRQRPGQRLMEETTNLGAWPTVVSAFRIWLLNLRRELDASDRAAASASTPEWALAELPAEYRAIRSEIEALAESERRMRRMAGLLWETGEPLNRLVRDVFRSFGAVAKSTPPGATYDVEVALRAGRLLVEVTGIEGQVNKGSKKIAQVLTALQSIAAPGDRVCVAVNAYRDKPLAERASLEILTKEAAELLTRLDAVVFTTADLFCLWRMTLSTPEQGASVIEGILNGPAGLVRLLDAA